MPGPMEDPVPLQPPAPAADDSARDQHLSRRYYVDFARTSAALCRRCSGRG